MPSKSRKSASKRATTASKAKKKTAPKRPVAKKIAAKKAGAKKTVAKKSVAKKTVAKKTVAKKTVAKKGVAKKVAAAASARKGAPAAKKPAKALTKKAPALAKAAAPKTRPAAPAKSAPPMRRRDSAGHIEKAYAKELLERSGPRERAEQSAQAFLGGPRTKDDLAEGMGEEFVETATSGEDEGEDVANQVVSEERGGPFVVTTAGVEFADGVDESNPKGAKREPFPTT